MTNKILQDKRILITGGTGSLGKVLIKRILSGEQGVPKKVTVFSRDEAKQFDMQVEYNKLAAGTDDILYNNFRKLLEFRIGDVRNFDSVLSAVTKTDIVINAAALKQVPSCEYFPEEAINTNIKGAENIVRAIKDFPNGVETCVCISTDKACKPVNVMGMTKALQERIFLRAGVHFPEKRFVAVRYGNVLASRGSVIPFFNQLIKEGKDLPITDEGSTRFFLSLNDAVDIIFESIASAKSGETYIPIAPAAKITDLAKVLIGKKNIKTKVIGMRPGEKLHEVLISEEEAQRAFKRNDYYVISSILPELQVNEKQDLPFTGSEYSSQNDLMNEDELKQLILDNGLEIAGFNDEAETSRKQVLG